MDVYLQSPRYVSPKTRCEAAKRLPRVEVASDAMFMRSDVCTRDIHKRVMFANYIFAKITSFAKFAKLLSRNVYA